jgi:hypothetical protein
MRGLTPDRPPLMSLQIVLSIVVSVCLFGVGLAEHQARLRSVPSDRKDQADPSGPVSALLVACLVASIIAIWIPTMLS